MAIQDLLCEILKKGKSSITLEHGSDKEKWLIDGCFTIEELLSTAILLYKENRNHPSIEEQILEVVKRNTNHPDFVHLLLMNLIGLVSEAGEVLDEFKKVYYFGNKIVVDWDNVKELFKKELSDTYYHFAALVTILDLDLHEIKNLALQQGMNRPSRDERFGNNIIDS